MADVLCLRDPEGKRATLAVLALSVGSLVVAGQCPPLVIFTAQWRTRETQKPAQERVCGVSRDNRPAES